KQIEPFNCGMHLGEEVIIVRRQEDDTFYVETDAGTQFTSRAVVIAGGVGSFQPRPLRVPDAELYEDRSLHYRVRDASQFHDRRIVILGGGDSALDWVLALVGKASHITLVHRRDEYRAAPASVGKMRSLVADRRMDLIEHGKAVAITGADGRMSAITVDVKAGESAEERSVVVPAEHALVFFGLSPKLGPIADWGLDINRKTINVDTERFGTSEPGIYAIGDINQYPGKKKLILCGFHEAALAAFAIKQRLEPDKKVHVQYTTTSPLMHKRLGIPD